jgi:hypothetical protein
MMSGILPDGKRWKTDSRQWAQHMTRHGDIREGKIFGKSENFLRGWGGGGIKMEMGINREITWKDM